MPDETTDTPAAETTTTTAPEPKPVHVAPSEPKIPESRWNEVLVQRDAAKERAAAAAVEKAEVTAALEAMQAELAAARAEATAHKIRGERDLVYAQMGDRPSLAHRDVRELVEAKYESYTASTTEAKPFSEWITEVAPESPVLSPYLTVPATPGKPRPPNPNAGAGNTAGTGGGAATTRADIQRKRASGTFTADDKKAEKEALRVAGIIK